MTIRTSKGTTHTVRWIDNPIQDADMLLLCMDDDRSIVQIVVEFDGMERIERMDENEGDKVFEGFTRLESIRRMQDNSVMILLGRGGSHG